MRSTHRLDVVDICTSYLEFPPGFEVLQSRHEFITEGETGTETDGQYRMRHNNGLVTVYAVTYAASG